MYGRVSSPPQRVPSLERQNDSAFPQPDRDHCPGDLAFDCLVGKHPTTCRTLFRSLGDTGGDVSATVGRSAGAVKLGENRWVELLGAPSRRP